MNYSDYEKLYNELNPNYKSIIVLEYFLKQRGIPYEMTRLMDGWKIAYPNENDCVFDVIEHRGSYGKTQDLMEAYGDGIEDVEGFMDIETALSHFERVHKKYGAESEE